MLGSNTLASPRARAVAVLALLVGLVGLAVWFGTLDPAPALGAYPGSEDLAADYDRYVGERVVVAGRAVGTDPVVVEATDADGDPVRYELAGLDRPVETGDGVWAFGVAEPGSAIRVERAVVTPPSGYAYAYAVSVLAGLWVLVRIVRDWRYDPEAVGLVPEAVGPVPEPTGPGEDGAGRSAAAGERDAAAPGGGGDGGA